MALPLILAGPILRRVDANGVSVFLALSVSAKVRLHVWQGSQMSVSPGIVNSGEAARAVGPDVQTLRIGANLHLVVVTAKPVGGLEPGGTYSYDVVINDSTGLLPEGLLHDEKANARLNGVDTAAPLHLALGFEEERLPSFAAAPAVLADLRVAYTSCRRANYEGPDSLGWLDDRMMLAAADPGAAWPHQLFLTGDQIYADDVGATMLAMLMRLSGELLGAAESFWYGEGLTVPLDRHSAPPLRRERVVRDLARMTTTSLANHLLGFGEFAAMYLIAWSARAWRAPAGDDEIFVPLGDINQDVRDLATAWEICHGGSFDAWKAATKEKLTAEIAAIEAYAAAVPKVARVLASIPTYMIWDDHEITDDWNLSGRWNARVYSNATGRMIVRNGCVAFGLFQGWGNDPGAFAETDSRNKAFLDEAVNLYKGAGPYPAAPTAAMEELIGFPSAEAKKRARWHYVVDSPCHRTIVLDTRTRRDTGAFVSIAPPKLLSGAALDEQLPPGPVPVGLQLLVLVSPAPVLGPDVFDRVMQPLLAGQGDVMTAGGDLRGKNKDPCKALKNEFAHQTGAEEYDMESWAADPVAYEALLKRLATYGRCVILSGDVHFSATLAMDYHRRTGDQTEVSRIVQLTASGERNGWPPEAAAALRANTVLQDLIGGVLVERIGWDGSAKIKLPDGAHVGPGRRARMNRSPALLPTAGWPAGTEFTKDAAGQTEAPDWRWRLNLISDRRKGSPPDVPDDPPPLQGGDIVVPANVSDPAERIKALPGYAATLARHQQVALTRKPLMRTMVFTANLGLLSFSAGAPDPKITVRIVSGPMGSGAEPSVGTLHEVDLARAAKADQPVLLMKLS